MGGDATGAAAVDDRRGRKPRTSFLAMAAASTAVAIAALFSARVLSADGNLRWLDFLVMAAAVGCAFLIRRSHRSVVLEWHRLVWPVTLLLGVDLAVRLISALQSGYQLSRLGMDSSLATTWLVAASTPVLALWAALVVGMVVGKKWDGFAAIAHAVVIGASLLASIAQRAADAGFLTGIASLTRWSAFGAANLWSPGAGESFRATGFEADPNSLGAIAVASLAWAVAAREHTAARIAIASGALGVLWLSASRTAAIAAFFCIAAVVLQSALSARHTGHAGAPRLARLAVPATALVLVVVALLTGALGQRVTQVVQASAQSAEQAPAAATSAPLYTLTGGRSERWQAGIVKWQERPLGWFAPSDAVVGLSLHSEYLDRLVWGGPLMLAAFVLMLGWLAVRFRPAGAPLYGLACAVSLAIVGVMQPAMLMPGFALLTMLSIGSALTERAPQAPPAESATATP